ncbi:MAG: SET domain-containing protein [Tildeniella torsiva UHER 1998/13D]|jgi:SET domain-containing protein|nr:SET domain-containing protein [Tildeniella torsiva UHER 1998/13D]
MPNSSNPSPKNSGDLSTSKLEHLIDNAPKCRPGESQIHGYGLIAFEVIKEGEIVIDFNDPNLYTEKKFSDLEPWRLEGGKYTGISEEKCLVSEAFTKYSLLNHSRQPNAVSNFKARHIVAIRDIFPGEEVTVDYRLEPVSPEAKTHIQHFL